MDSQRLEIKANKHLLLNQCGFYLARGALMLCLISKWILKFHRPDQVRNMHYISDMLLSHTWSCPSGKNLSSKQSKEWLFAFLDYELYGVYLFSLDLSNNLKPEDEWVIRSDAPPWFPRIVSVLDCPCEIIHQSSKLLSKVGYSGLILY